MRYFLLLFIAAVPAYLLGSINGAIITSKSFYRKDIRKFGSGNPGLTNFYRVFGKGGALLVVAIDVIKTIAPVIFGGWLFGRYTGMAISEVSLFGRHFNMSMFGQLISGFFVMLGHCFPAYYGLKGGKAVMAIGAVMFVFDWRLALISWGAFIVVTAISRYVSLGAIIGAATIPVVQALLGLGRHWEIAASALCAVLLIARHHQNIGRLVRGEESRFSFRRKKGEAS